VRTLKNLQEKSGGEGQSSPGKAGGIAGKFKKKGAGQAGTSMERILPCGTALKPKVEDRKRGKLGQPGGGGGEAPVKTEFKGTPMTGPT